MKKIIVIVSVLAFFTLFVTLYYLVGLEWLSIFEQLPNQLPNQIDSFGSFIKVSLILLIITIGLSRLMGGGGLALLITSIILFFLVLFGKDYGFFTTVLLVLLPIVLWDWDIKHNAHNDHRVFWSSLRNILGSEQTMTKNSAWRKFIIVNGKSILRYYLLYIAVYFLINFL